MIYRETLSGPKPLSSETDKADGSIKLGSWWLKAGCSEREGTLIIRAARKVWDDKKKKKFEFAKDPLSGQTQDWAARNALVFGTDGGAIPICYGKGTMTTEFTYASREFAWAAKPRKLTMNDTASGATANQAMTSGCSCGPSARKCARLAACASTLSNSKTSRGFRP